MGLGAALVAGAAALQALHAVGSVAPAARPAQAAARKSFVPVCKSNEVADARPDPAWVGASFANDHCLAPSMPVAPDGYTAKREQIVAGMAAVKGFIAVSDAYQKCIGDFVALRKAEAGNGKKPLTQAQIVIENHRIFASEENKKKASDRMKVAINAFNEYGSECPD